MIVLCPSNKNSHNIVFAKRQDGTVYGEEQQDVRRRIARTIGFGILGRPFPPPPHSLHTLLSPSVNFRHIVFCQRHTSLGNHQTTRRNKMVLLLLSVRPKTLLLLVSLKNKKRQQWESSKCSNKILQFCVVVVILGTTYDASYHGYAYKV